MKKGLTELVFIVDRSGSMAGLEKDTIGGFNAMLKEQAEPEKVPELKVPERMQAVQMREPEVSNGKTYPND